MEHDTNRISIGRLVKAYIEEKGLPFYVEPTDGQFTGRMICSIYAKHGPYNMGRCRAVIWEYDRLMNAETRPFVTIYDVNPKREYTAIGDRRCDLSIADPNFFEQLEYHLQHELIDGKH